MSNRIKISRNFYLDEFVYPELYNQWKEKSIYWVAQRRITTAQTARSLLGKPVAINDWFDGGEFKHSGLRPFDCPVGATLSQHKFNTADDLKSEGMSGWDWYHFIKKYWHTFKDLGVTTIEHPDMTPTWCHIDGRNVYGIHDLKNGPLIIRP